MISSSAAPSYAQLARDFNTYSKEVGRFSFSSDIDSYINSKGSSLKSIFDCPAAIEEMKNVDSDSHTILLNFEKRVQDSKVKNRAESTRKVICILKYHRETYAKELKKKRKKGVRQ